MIFQPGNDIEVLRNGKEIFPSMLEAIENAEENIEFVTFIYWQGDIARTFAELTCCSFQGGSTGTSDSRRLGKQAHEPRAGSSS